MDNVQDTSSTPFIEFLQQYHLLEGSKRKILPEWIFSMPSHIREQLDSIEEFPFCSNDLVRNQPISSGHSRPLLASSPCPSPQPGQKMPSETPGDLLSSMALNEDGEDDEIPIRPAQSRRTRRTRDPLAFSPVFAPTQDNTGNGEDDFCSESDGGLSDHSIARRGVSGLASPPDPSQSYRVEQASPVGQPSATSSSKNSGATHEGSLNGITPQSQSLTQSFSASQASAEDFSLSRYVDGAKQISPSDAPEGDLAVRTDDSAVQAYRHKCSSMVDDAATVAEERDPNRQETRRHTVSGPKKMRLSASALRSRSARLQLDDGDEIEFSSELSLETIKMTTGIAYDAEIRQDKVEGGSMPRMEVVEMSVSTSEPEEQDPPHDGNNNDLSGAEGLPLSGDEIVVEGPVSWPDNFPPPPSPELPRRHLRLSHIETASHITTSHSASRLFTPSPSAKSSRFGRARTVPATVTHVGAQVHFDEDRISPRQSSSKQEPEEVPAQQELSCEHAEAEDDSGMSLLSDLRSPSPETQPKLGGFRPDWHLRYGISDAYLARAVSEQTKIR